MDTFCERSGSGATTPRAEGNLNTLHPDCWTLSGLPTDAQQPSVASWISEATLMA
jgi:hypothetical protein